MRSLNDEPATLRTGKWPDPGEVGAGRLRTAVRVVTGAARGGRPGYLDHNDARENARFPRLHRVDGGAAVVRAAKWG